MPLTRLDGTEGMRLTGRFRWPLVVALLTLGLIAAAGGYAAGISGRGGDSGQALPGLRSAAAAPTIPNLDDVKALPQRPAAGPPPAVVPPPVAAPPPAVSPPPGSTPPPAPPPVAQPTEIHH